MGWSHREPAAWTPHVCNSLVHTGISGHIQSCLDRSALLAQPWPHTYYSNLSIGSIFILPPTTTKNNTTTTAVYIDKIVTCVQSSLRGSKADRKWSLILILCQELPISWPKSSLQTSLTFIPVVSVKGGLASLHSHLNKKSKCYPTIASERQMNEVRETADTANKALVMAHQRQDSVLALTAVCK